MEQAICQKHARPAACTQAGWHTSCQSINGWGSMWKGEHRDLAIAKALVREPGSGRHALGADAASGALRMDSRRGRGLHGPARGLADIRPQATVMKIVQSRGA